MRKRRMWIGLAFLLVRAAGAWAGDGTLTDLRAEKVIVVVADGLRWQEVFRGADETLFTKEHGGVDDAAALRASYWRDTPEDRRKLPLPFSGPPSPTMARSGATATRTAPYGCRTASTSPTRATTG